MTVYSLAYYPHDIHFLAFASLAMAYYARGVAYAAKGRLAEARMAIARFREGLGSEDTGLYFEPPKWYYPIGESLGAALVKAGRSAEAETVYREDLKRFPENGWSLFGLAGPLRPQRKSAGAAAAEKRFSKAWSAADVRPTASRF